MVDTRQIQILDFGTTHDYEAEKHLPNKTLLETLPLYKRLDLLLPLQRHRWPKPAISATCPRCGRIQTFNMINDYDQHDETKPTIDPSGRYPPYSSVVRLVYSCAGCNESRRYFLVFVQQPRVPRAGVRGIPTAPPTEAEAQLVKVGQFPSWDIAPDPTLGKKLGERVDIYKRGLICESQGYGLGAFAYYRRIIENVIDELLNDIHAIVPQDVQVEYAAALEAVRASHRAADKIDHVKDLLPSSLRPGGANPLAVLHTVLSQGLHDLPEDECLQLASVLRNMLVHLVHQLYEAKAAADQYAKDLQLLLQRQAARQQDRETPPPGAHDEGASAG